MHYFRQRIIDCVVGVVVEQVYSGAVTYNRENTKTFIPLKCFSLLNLSLKMQLNAFGGRAPRGPLEEFTTLLQLAGLKVKGKEKGRGSRSGKGGWERGMKERGIKGSPPMSGVR